MSDELFPDDVHADDLLTLAPVVGLNALTAEELHQVERTVAAAPAEVQRDFHTQVRAARETMASMSRATATAPPAALRDRILSAARAESTWIRSEPPAAAQRVLTAESSSAVESSAVESYRATVHQLESRHRRTALLATLAAVVLAVAIGAVGWAIGASNTSPPTTSPTAERVFAAKDVRTATGALATGTATVTYSHSSDAGVLVMNDVPPPKPGTVYQMWLTTPTGMTSAGTMTDGQVSPSTTAIISNVKDATALSFTVESGAGSEQPTGPLVASLPLR